ncbi:MAG: adenylosuccinate synthase [Planctomycetota bacterium]|nr:MAG: adenylosuccinate synthase [Planctomycetota bacterium]REJ87113.1 MAG: adenylosuccinate synthase [Planctomycetota bacterium]
MPGSCVIGLQWGDEAKGKLVDLLTEQHEVVVRYQGGANAGHTVVVGDEIYKLSLIPSGILRPGVKCVIAGGVVIHPATILEEIAMLRDRGVEVGENLLISDRAHVIFPWHTAEDRVLDESTADGENIGTTQRGIGPCYRDKVGRAHAVRLGDFYRDSLAGRIERIVAAKNESLAALRPGIEPLDAAAIAREYAEYAAELERHVVDTTSFLLDCVDRDRPVLFEGAQGSLLDVDHGTYPFVTSSNSSGIGVAAGAGVPPRFVQRAIGVIKAYSTRVGGGPFPTEQDNDIGQQLRDQGNEYGTVTRRPRRCGWFDAVATRYTARIGGIDEVAVMLLDVLSGLPELKICTAYEIDGRRVTDFPSHVDDLRRAVPVFETLESWDEDVSGARELSDLPPAACAYLDRLSELLERPVSFVSVGPERAQTIIANFPAAASLA